MAAGLPPHYLACVDVASHGRFGGQGAGLVHRGVDVLPLARDRPIQQGRSSGHHRKVAPHVPGLPAAGSDGRRVRLLLLRVPAARHLTARRQVEQVAGRVVLPRPILTKGGQRAHYQTGIVLLQVIVAQTQGGHVAGLERLQHHVGLGRQTPEQPATVLGLQGQGYAALGCVVMPEGEAPVPVGHILEERPNRPRLLASRRLNLDDVCAHIGQQLAAPLAFLIGELQHSNSGEGPLRLNAGRMHRRRRGVPSRVVARPLRGRVRVNHLLQIRIGFHAHVFGPERAVLKAIHKLLVADSQQALEDILVVLAYQGAGAAVEHRRFRHLEWSVLKRPRTQHRMLHVPVHLPMPEMRIVVEAVLAALHRHRPHAGRLAQLHDLVLAQGLRPRLDSLVNLLLVLQSAIQGCELVRDRPCRRTHNSDQPAPLVV